MTSAVYVSCVVLRAGYEPHLTGPKRGASDAVGRDSSSPGSCQPASPSLRFSGMLAAAHTLTTIPRDLLPRLLFPDAPNLRNECRGRDKSPAKGHKEPGLCRPASSHQRVAGRLRSVPKAGGRCWLFVPVLCCHQTQSREVIWVRLARELHPTSADFSQSTPLGQARMGQPHSLPYRNL